MHERKKKREEEKLDDLDVLDLGIKRFCYINEFNSIQFKIILPDTAHS